MKKNYCIGFCMCLIFSVTSCSKFLVIDPPPDKVVSSQVFIDDKTATAAIAGLYSNMMQIEGLFSFYLTADGGLLSDELLNNTSTNQFANNSLTASNTDIASFWTNAYANIFSANSIINGIENSTGLSPAVKTQIMGEALLTRSLVYFYMVSLWNDVPLALTPDYRINAFLPRTAASSVYQQIVTDLLKAQSLLPASYITTEKNRPNKLAATALLARVYLYMRDWQNAAKQAGAVIESNLYALTPALKDIFLKNSSESIWQFSPVNLNYNTLDGKNFIPSTTNTLPVYPVNQGLVNAFEPGDKRKDNWLGIATFSGSKYYYPLKYKIASGSPLSEYYMILRLAEQYLIRAEANAQSNNQTAAVTDLNIIRSRAGLSPLLSSLNGADLTKAIEQERRVELCLEMGHRWFDLKRLGRLDAVLGSIKPGWISTNMFLPVPINQILLNGSLKQNAGY